VELLLALLVGGAAFAGGRLWWDRRSRRQDEAAGLAGVRALADEDVTLLGEELHRLDTVVGRLDSDGRADYQRALDAYESAQRLVPRLSSHDEVDRVTDTLSAGRYALACVRARLEGRPLPEQRVPCFFNPQHGPSVRDVVYTSRRRGTRTVPACAQDAARVEAGQEPHALMVTVGERRVPYWDAGRAYQPYGAGYFVSGAFAQGEVLAWAFVPPVGDDGAGHHGPTADRWGLFAAGHSDRLYEFEGRGGRDEPRGRS
jgi:hypothetical protein